MHEIQYSWTMNQLPLSLSTLTLKKLNLGKLCQKIGRNGTERPIVYA